MLRTMFVKFVKIVSVAHSDIEDKINALDSRVLLLEEELKKVNSQNNGVKMSKKDNQNSNKSRMA